jgi:DNA-binding NarL/FixJ family response regulator
MSQPLTGQSLPARDPTNDVVHRRSLWTAVVLLLAIALLIGVDLATDYRIGATAMHVVVEATVMLLAAIGATVLWRELASARAAVSTLTRDVARAEQDAVRWQAEAQQALRSMREAMNRQFARWNLTDAERDVALGLLQGSSHKQIAATRGTSERTVRQQSQAIYEKGGLDGRSALSAFFLNGLSRPDRTMG